MINLDQVRTLEWKVKQAVQLIVHLRRENDALRGRLSDTEVRLQDMESLLETFKANQSEMESGIRSALEELDHLEGAPTPEGPGPVAKAPVSSLPIEVSEPEAAPEPGVASEPEAVSVPEVEAVVAAPVSEPEPSFEDEYAALVAAEAVSVEEPSPVAPESVELEDTDSLLGDGEEDSLFFETEPEAEPAAEPEERRPEQPGLGIF